MAKRSTTTKGNEFRDLVARVLSAAGFSTRTEERLAYKDVDVAAVWSRDEMAGPQRYAFEAKDFNGTLPLAEATEFAADMVPLLSSGEIDQAWLVSRGPISTAGRQVADTHRGLQVMTFEELQRRLLLIDSYLRDLVSSFASHLTAAMARKALADPMARAPILVRLGEIADEQSIEGLLGKVLASQHRVSNYHFDTLRALNRVGRFLIIYDGFDEMKHGLTPSKFQLVLSELFVPNDCKNLASQGPL